MVTAVSHEDADVRRQAVADVARSRQRRADWAVKGFQAIALLESDPQARCVAIRALGETGDPVAAGTMLRVLNAANEPPAEVRAAGAAVRWEAVTALADLATRGQVAEGDRMRVEQALIAALSRDADRLVREEAARGLSHFRSESSVTALIAGLEDPDFAVVHRCEESLVALTGVTHDCAVDAWQRWFAENRTALFAHAGRIPESRRPAYTNRWEKSNYEARKLWEWAFPPKKEQ